MTDQNFSPQDSLRIIHAMIEKTKQDIFDQSHYFLLWGWRAFIGCIGQYILKVHFNYPRHYLVWLITFLCLAIMIFFLVRDAKKEKVRTYTGDNMSYLWTGLGISFFVLMLLVAENIKVGLVTEHLPIKDVAQHITRESIFSKLKILHASLQKDFGIDRPRIAVLGLNPHAGDEGLIGKEEEEFIKPAIKEAKQNNMLVIGPFSADAFFARGQYEKFDAVLAMYHDQGLIPFKSLSVGEGVNFTAGIPGMRTSPDHGTAFDIAGQNKADESSFRAAVFTCIDVLTNRRTYDENRKNPLKKMSAGVVANAVDEKIVEDSE